MLLELQNPFLSIVSLPPTQLPSFTLITGLNGTGKTHLLRALAGGQVRADIAPDFNADIRFYDWNTMVPQDTGLFQSETLQSERINLMQAYNGQVNQPHIRRA